MGDSKAAPAFARGGFEAFEEVEEGDGRLRGGRGGEREIGESWEWLVVGLESCAGWFGVLDSTDHSSFGGASVEGALVDTSSFMPLVIDI